MSDYVIAIRFTDVTYYRDQYGQFWSGDHGTEYAERFPTIEAAKRVVQVQFPSQRKRLCIIPAPSRSSKMFDAGALPSASAVPPGSPA